MKLSRRGKSARRGRHTKRTGKHLRYKGKKVRASKRYHRGHKRTHKRGRRLHMGRIKRGGADDDDGIPVAREPVPEAEITEHERKLAEAEADKQYKRLEELNMEYGSKPLGEFLERFAKILDMQDTSAKTKRLIFMTEYAKQITDTMVHDKDDKINNILKDYLKNRIVDGIFI